MQLQQNRQGEPTACSLQCIQQAEHKYIAPLSLPVQAIAAAGDSAPQRPRLHKSTQALYSHTTSVESSRCPKCSWYFSISAGISVFQLVSQCHAKGRSSVSAPPSSSKLSDHSRAEQNSWISVGTNDNFKDSAQTESREGQQSW